MTKLRVRELFRLAGIAVPKRPKSKPKADRTRGREANDEGTTVGSGGRQVPTQPSASLVDRALVGHADSKC